jgi:hypothetical protein
MHWPQAFLLRWASSKNGCNGVKVQYLIYLCQLNCSCSMTPILKLSHVAPQGDIWELFLRIWGLSYSSHSQRKLRNNAGVEMATWKRIHASPAVSRAEVKEQPYAHALSWGSRNSSHAKAALELVEHEQERKTLLLRLHAGSCLTS